MKAVELLSRDFDVIDAAWPLARIRETLAKLDAEWILLRQVGAPPASLFFAFTRAAIIRQLAGHAPDVSSALGLGRLQAAPLVDSDAPAKRTKAAQVVIEDGQPVGIIRPLTATRSTVTRGRSTAHALAQGDGNVVIASAPLTRYLTAELPAEVIVDEAVSLLVSLSSIVSADAAGVLFAKPAGTKIDVVIKAAEGLVVVGRADGVLEVSEPQLEQPVQFKIRGDRLGSGNVRIYAFSDGVSIAMLRLTLTVVGAQSSASQKPERTERIAVEAAARQAPDLSLFIFETGSELTFRLSSASGAYHMQPFGPIALKSSPADYFSSFFQDIENLPLENAEQRQLAAGKLAAKGASLFNAVFPDDLKVLLWSLRDRIETVQITSDEPWIPWEMCQLTGDVDGRVEDGPFFAEAFKVTRWLPGAALASSLRLSNIALVVPGDSRLPQAEEERRFVMSLASGTRAVTEVPARYADVKARMGQGIYDAWHFTGHARGNLSGDADRAAIELENRETLSPEDIHGRTENMLLPRPFIFLNACQSAQAGLSLTGPGGWAKRFLSSRIPKRTASGFIGSYWSVYDTGALNFARSFYGALLDGKPIGEAGKVARLAVRKQGDPTWLAYTIYADPYAKLDC